MCWDLVLLYLRVFPVFALWLYRMNNDTIFFFFSFKHTKTSSFPGVTGTEQSTDNYSSTNTPMCFPIFYEKEIDHGYCFLKQCRVLSSHCFNSTHSTFPNVDKGSEWAVEVEWMLFPAQPVHPYTVVVATGLLNLWADRSAFKMFLHAFINQRHLTLAYFKTNINRAMMVSVWNEGIGVVGAGFWDWERMHGENQCINFVQKFIHWFILMNFFHQGTIWVLNSLPWFCLGPLFPIPLKAASSFPKPQTLSPL